MLVTVSLLAFKQAASAQAAHVTGIVTDVNSAVIPGAQVALNSFEHCRGAQGGDERGWLLRIPFVPPGKYRLKVLAKKLQAGDPRRRQHQR